MKTTEEVNQMIKESEDKGFNIWSNPNTPDRSVSHGDECEYCFRRKCGSNPLHVHVTTDGTIVPKEISEEELALSDHESQGCWPIGSTCAKKLLGKDLEKYTFRYSDKK